VREVREVGEKCVKDVRPTKSPLFWCLTDFTESVKKRSPGLMDSVFSWMVKRGWGFCGSSGNIIYFKNEIIKL
jgi:hypothetical protein